MNERMKRLTGDGRLKKITAFFAAWLLLLSCVDVSAKAAGYSGTLNSGGGIKWTLNTSTGVLTLSGSGVAENLDSSNGYGYSPWMGSYYGANDKWSTYGVYVKKVVIGDGITGISYNLFANLTNLTSVTIPSTVTKIGDYAFYGCSSLTGTLSAAGVTWLGTGAFYGCSSLTGLYLPKISSYNGSPFSGCTAVKSIEVGSGNVALTSLFYGCTNVESFVVGRYYKGYNTSAGHFGKDFPNVKTVSGKCGANAAWKLDITSGELVISGSGAMDNYESAKFGIYSPDEGRYYADQATTTAPWGGGIGYGNIRSITIGDNITSIGNYAFYGLWNYYWSELSYYPWAGSTLTFHMGSKIISIGNAAFAVDGVAGFVDLSGISLPEGLKTIGDSAFSGWTRCNLTSITIPSTVCSIGDYAFYSVGSFCHDGTVYFLPISCDMGEKCFYLDGEIYAVNPKLFKDSAGSLDSATWNYNSYDASLYSLYEIRFEDYDGTLISSQYVGEGQKITKPSNPTYAADPTYTYTFARWTPSVPTTAKGNTTFTAVYNQTYKNYTITFQDWDGTVLSKRTDYHYGDSVSTPTPTRASDNTYDYAFTGWNTAVTNVAANKTYTAQYSKTYRSYEVVFKDHDGTVLSSSVYHWGDTVNVPAAARDGYTFTGWSSEVSTTCSGAKTYTAQYVLRGDLSYTVEYRKDSITGEKVYPTKTVQNVAYGSFVLENAVDVAGYTVETSAQSILISTGENRIVFIYAQRPYTITFVDSDGEILSKKSYCYGDAVLAPVDPSKEEDDTYTYTFAGWEPLLTTVTADKTYTAAYVQTFKEYTITFLDYDGTVLLEKTDYHYGDSVQIPADPEREEDDLATYFFRGWDSTVTSVTGSKTYTARYNTFPKNYCIMFYNWDMTLLYLKSDHRWGDSVYEPTVTTAPASENEKLYINVFSGWSPEFSGICQGSTIYTAQFERQYIEYNVTFLDYDGTVLSDQIYHYGDVVTAPTPTRAADERYTYSFAGWNTEPAPLCEESATYVAVYDAEYINYSVRFEDHDGTVLLEKTDYHYGDSVQIPANPTRPATVEHTYSFIGWSPDVSGTVNGDAVYTALYAEAVAEYSVVFRDWDDRVISETVYDFGDSVDVTDCSTYSHQDDTYIYSFCGWSPEVIPSATGNALYVAQYQSVFKEYTITFLDYDGTVLSSSGYHWGDVIAVPTSPTRAQEENIIYTFAGWDRELQMVCNGTMVYTATYESRERLYTVQFLDHDGTPLSVRTDYRYGETVEIPTDPARSPDAENTYTFVGWSPVVTAVVTSDAIYTATYESEPRTNNSSGFGGSSTNGSWGSAGAQNGQAEEMTYTVKFFDWDGTLLSVRTDYQSGERVEIPADPTRAADETFTYTFAGWNPDVADVVTEDAAYAATYTAVEIPSVEEPEQNEEPVQSEEPEQNEEPAQSEKPVQGEEPVPNEVPEHEEQPEQNQEPGVEQGGETKVYTVIFEDWDGSVISSAICLRGDTPTEPGIPERQTDGRYVYVFSGWKQSLSKDGIVTFVASYTAREVAQQDSTQEVPEAPSGDKNAPVDGNESDLVPSDASASGVTVIERSEEADPPRNSGGISARAADRNSMGDSCI